MKVFFQNKLELVLLICILIINILLKVTLQAQGFFAFAYDQGRDFLEVSKIIYDHKFTLIGQTTGLSGIFYGPWWYYFLSPILYISKGDPQIVAIFFSIFGVITTLLLYFLLKYITKNISIAVILTIAASMSSYWFGPTSIWNPSMVPLLTIIYIFTIKKIFDTKKSIYFFLLGVLLLFITDSETAFGLSIILSQLAGLFLYRKVFFDKKLFLTFIGASIVLAPRVVFDLKHNFLISKSIIAYAENPIIHASKLTLTSRLAIRSNQIFSIFSESLFESHKLVALIYTSFVVLLFIYILMKKKVFTTFKQDLFFQYLLFLGISILILFSIFKDNVWDYYLIGLPLILICILAKIFDFLLNNSNFKLIVFALFLILLFSSFNTDLFNFKKITWQGDGATYRNPKAVIDYLASEKATNYSLYSYSPSIYDYPMDYLVTWYQRKNLLQAPKKNQNIIYLTIRDDSTHRYFRDGWYGDKTQDKTDLIERETFNGNFILEKHIKHD